MQELQAKIVNCTPHPVTIYDRHGRPRTFAPVAGIVRCNEIQVIDRYINDLPVVRTECNKISPTLPNPDGGKTFYIVSRKILNALKGSRDDLLVPSDVIRDGNDFVVGCRSFAMN